MGAACQRRWQDSMCTTHHASIQSISGSALPMALGPILGVCRRQQLLPRLAHARLGYGVGRGNDQRRRVTLEVRVQARCNTMSFLNRSVSGVGGVDERKRLLEQVVDAAVRCRSRWHVEQKFKRVIWQRERGVDCSRVGLPTDRRRFESKSAGKRRRLSGRYQSPRR